MGVFVDKIEYNKEKDSIKIKMKYYDHNKKEKTFEVESDFSIPLDPCTPSAKSYFNMCNDKIKDILNNIKIAKPKYKINQKLSFYDMYKHREDKYVFNSTATPLNEIVEEKETLSKFHNFCFDKFKTDIEHEVGSFGLDKYFKDKKKEYEELIDSDSEEDKKSLIDNNIKENKKENYNIIKSFEDENKRLNNIHQIQKIMEQAKAKNIQEQIKNKQLSTKGIDKEEQIKYDQNIISSYEQIKRQEVNKNNLKNYLQNFLDEHKEDKKILQPVQDQVDKIKTEQCNKYKRSQSLIVDTGIKDKNILKDKLNICNYFAKQMLSEKELNSNDNMKQIAKQKINDLVYSTDKLKKRNKKCYI